jgi:amidohydrolase
MTEPLRPPYQDYFAHLARRIEADGERAGELRSPYPGAPTAVRKRIAARTGDLAAELVELSHDIHDHPELGFAEHHAVGTVTRLVERHGHKVESGAYGLPTALRSRAGDGRPRVALLAEYDALPGLGHACGHNIICATAVGAYLAAAEALGAVGGSVELIGTPAEEGGGGKELIARAGGFDDVDAALMLHPHWFEAAEHPWIGARQVEVVYRGLAAHASAMPFLGRNALDGVVAAYNALAQLRQHLLPTDRVHGVITDGGERPNIVPERAAATFYIRSALPETLAELSERVEAIFTSAAAATATVVEVAWDPSPVYLPVRSSRPLAARYATNMATRGRRVLPIGVVPETLAGSTDLGNVSVRVPAIHPTLSIAPVGVSIHTPEFARWAVSGRADQGVLDGATGMALTAVDFLADPALRGAAAREFTAAGGVMDTRSLLLPAPSCRHLHPRVD